MILLPLIGVAHADMYVVCLGYSIVATQPAPDASAVALDAPLRVGLSDGGCELDESLTLTLRDIQGEVVEEWSFDNADLDASLGVVTVTPSAPLTALSAYTLEATLSTREAVEVHFNTGEDGLSPLAEDPQWTSLHAGTTCSGGSGATAQFTPADDPAPLMELRRDGEVVGRGLPNDDGMNVSVADQPEELCLELVQVDGLGGERSGGERCATVPEADCNGRTPGRGCANAPGLEALLPALLGLLGLRRKRG